MADAVPYNIVIVDFPECGHARLVSNLIDATPEEIHIGMEVSLLWEAAGGKGCSCLASANDEEDRMRLIWLLVVGLVAGWLAGQLSKGRGFGVVGDIVVGILGAVFGGFLFRLLGIYPDGGFLSQLVTATVGAVALLFLVRVVKSA